MGLSPVLVSHTGRIVLLRFLSLTSRHPSTSAACWGSTCGFCKERYLLDQGWAPNSIALTERYLQQTTSPGDDVGPHKVPEHHKATPRSTHTSCWPSKSWMHGAGRSPIIQRASEIASKQAMCSFGITNKFNYSSPTPCCVPHSYCRSDKRVGEGWPGTNSSAGKGINQNSLSSRMLPRS